MPRQESQSGPTRSATTGTPGKDLRAAESPAIGGAGSESPGDSEESRGLEPKRPERRGSADTACWVGAQSETTRRLKRRVSHEESREGLGGETNPWEYRLGCWQQCCSATRTRQWSNALKSRLPAPRALLFGAGQAGQGDNGKKAKKSGDGHRLLTRGRLRRA